MSEIDWLAAELETAGLKAVPFQDDPDAWYSVWQQLPYQPVAYARTMIEYQHAYYRGAGWNVQDISLILFNDNRPFGIWPLAIAADTSGDTRLTSSGAAVMSPLLLEGISSGTTKKICGSVVKFLGAVGYRFGLKTIMVEQGVQPDKFGEGATKWHQQMMTAGASPSIRHDLFVDLSRDETEIRSSIRKRYKSLINVGLRNWNVSVIDKENISDSEWDEFRTLHREVAGRATRSDQTWAMQAAMIRADEAFLVCLRDPSDGRLVGAGFFQYTRDEGLYAVGAYDRSLFDKPLGHVVQNRAIEYLKTDGRRWYKIGERFYQQDSSHPTDKEVSIASFKEGFSSHMFCRFIFQLPIADEKAI